MTIFVDYEDLFPESEETRHLVVIRGDAKLPANDYVLNERYCADVACGSNTRRWLDVDGLTGHNPSIVVGADGNPLVAYSAFDEASQLWQLRLAACTDQNCEGSQWFPLDPANAVSFGPRAMAVRGDGLPVIVYRKLDSNTLTLYECTVPDCSSGVPRPEFRRSMTASAEAAPADSLANSDSEASASTPSL